MIASYLKPSLDLREELILSKKKRRVSVQKKNQDLIKPLLVSMCFLICIVVVPERPSELASICEKYNSSVACEVW